MTPRDLEPLAPDGSPVLSLDDHAFAASAAVRQKAATRVPQPLGGRPLGSVGRLRVAAVVLVVAAVIGAAVGFAASRSHTSAPARPPHPQSPGQVLTTVAHELASGQFDRIASAEVPGPPLNTDALGLEVGWQAVTKRYGPLRSVSAPTIVSGQEATAVLTMGDGDLLLVVYLQPNGALSGIGLPPARRAGAPVLDDAYVLPQARAEVDAMVRGDVQATSATLIPCTASAGRPCWRPPGTSSSPPTARLSRFPVRTPSAPGASARTS